jgi:hypothetical protein
MKNVTKYSKPIWIKELQLIVGFIDTRQLYNYSWLYRWDVLADENVYNFMLF